MTEVQMEPTVMAEEPNVAVGRGKIRKILTLPEELAARVRDFRFARKYDRESEAYIELIERGLKTVEREEKEKHSRI